MAAQHRRPGSPGVYPPAHLGSPQGPSIHQRTKVLFPQHGVVARARVISAFQSTRLHQGLRMRVEWRPRSTRRLATRRSPPALVTVDRCGQQASRAAGCASECRDSRVYMSWCLRPVHDMACSSDREHVIWLQLPYLPSWRCLPSVPRPSTKAWHMPVFRQAKRHGLHTCTN